jgi:hypothetical protein
MTSWSQATTLPLCQDSPSFYEFIVFLKFKLCALIMVLIGSMQLVISLISNGVCILVPEGY